MPLRQIRSTIGEHASKYENRTELEVRVDEVGLLAFERARDARDRVMIQRQICRNKCEEERRLGCWHNLGDGDYTWIINGDSNFSRPSPVCSLCGIVKPESYFSNRGFYSTADGYPLYYACNACSAARNLFADNDISAHPESWAQHARTGLWVHRESGEVYKANEPGDIFTYELVGMIGNNGYIIIDASSHHGILAIHRVVYEACMGTIIPKRNAAGKRLVIAHGDDDKRNNAFTNLRCITQGENLRDARAHGLVPRPAAPRKIKAVIPRTSPKFPDLQVIYESAYEAEKKTGIRRSIIISICKGGHRKAAPVNSGGIQTFFSFHLD